MLRYERKSAKRLRAAQRSATKKCLSASGGSAAEKNTMRTHTILRLQISHTLHTINLLHMWRDQVKYQHSSTSAEIPKTGQNTRIQRGEQWDHFFFASRFDAVELRSSLRLLATAQNTNSQVRLRGLWAMADALCAES